MESRKWLDDVIRTGLARPDDVVRVCYSGWLRAYILLDVRLDDIPKLSMRDGQIRCDGGTVVVARGGNIDAGHTVRMLKWFARTGKVWYPYLLQNVPFAYDEDAPVQSLTLGVMSWFRGCGATE